MVSYHFKTKIYSSLFYVQIDGKDIVLWDSALDGLWEAYYNLEEISVCPTERHDCGMHEGVQIESGAKGRIVLYGTVYGRRFRCNKKQSCTELYVRNLFYQLQKNSLLRNSIRTELKKGLEFVSIL